MSRYTPLQRAAALTAFAVSGAVAAVTSIVPSTDAELLIAKAAKLEPVAIRADEALLPSPETYVREERFQRGDTLPALFARLGVGDTDSQRLLRQRELRLLRPGTTVSAEVRADGANAGELAWLTFLAPRDTEVTIERIGERLVANERRARVFARTELKSAVFLFSVFGATD